MFEVYALLVGCTILANMADDGHNRPLNDSSMYLESKQSKRIPLVLLILVMVWFSGTRTRMNDTYNYIQSFSIKVVSGLSGLKAINWSIGNNPLFYIYQTLLKTFVSNDPQVFILVTSLIVVVSMVIFLYKYAWRFGQTIYVFIAFTIFGFTMAAMKQTLATSVAIWIVPCIQNRKHFKALILLVIAALIHPYVIVLSIAFVLYGKGIWNRTVYIIFGITFLIGIFFSAFTNVMFRLTELIGHDYEENWETASAGVGLARVFVYAIAPALSIIYRDKLEEHSHPFYDLCINMSVVGLCFSIISSFGGAVLLGRIPNYFGLFICIAIPYILSVIDEPVLEETHGYIKASTTSTSAIALIVYAAYLYYYITYYNKYFQNYPVGLWGSIYDRVSLLSVFFGR